MKHMKWSRIVCAIGVLLALAASDELRRRRKASLPRAVTGVVKDAQGAVIPGASIVAVHRAVGHDVRGGHAGRWTVHHARHARRWSLQGHGLACLGSAAKKKIGLVLNLGVSQDLEFTLKVANVAETITRRRSKRSGVQFGPDRRAQPPCFVRISRPLPTISGRITDITAPDAAVRRQRHVRRAGQPREQHDGGRLVLQQLVRPGRHDRRHRRPHRRRADFARGDRAGAGQRRAVRRPPGQLHRRRRQHRHAQRQQLSSPPSAYYRTRNEDCSDLTNVDTCSGFVGTTAAGLRFNPVQLQDENCGRVGRRSDRQEQAVRVRHLREAGRHAPADDVHVESRRRAGRRATRPACSHRISARSARSCRRGSSYDTGPFDNIAKLTPAKPWMLKGDYNVNSAQQGHVPLQPARLEQPVRQNGSSALGTVGRPTGSTNFLEFREFELRDPREPQVRRGRVELGVRQHDEQPADRLHEAGREPRPRRTDAALPVRRHRRRRRHARYHASAASRSRRSTCSATAPSSCRTA